MNLLVNLVLQPLVSSVAKLTLSVRKIWSWNPGLVTLTPTARHRCNISSLRCVARALCRGDGPRHSLHATE